MNAPRHLIPPIAPQRPRELVHHGHKRVDPYYWIRDEGWQRVMREPDQLAAEIRAYLEAENAYCNAMLDDTQALQEALIAELRGRIKEDDASVPQPDGPFFYLTRYETGGEHPILCRRARADDGEAVLLHGDREAEGQSYFDIINFVHSPDHRHAAYAVDLNGSEYCTIRIRVLDTGADLSEAISDAHGDIVWAADSASFLYTKLDEHHRPNRVFAHRLGDDPSLDRLVYEESDPAFYLSLSRGESRRFIFIIAHDHQSTEIRLLPTDGPEAEPRIIAPRRPGHEYSIADFGDHFLILTNSRGAEDFKLMAAPAAAAPEEAWRDWLPHEPGRLILQILGFRRHLVRLERVNALPRIVVTRLGAQGERVTEHVIAFAEEAFSLDLVPGFEFDTNILRFRYSSPTTPHQTFAYDMDARTRTRLKTQEVPSGHNPDDYVVRRLLAPSEDGETVPVTLLHRKDLARDGRAPLLLYGYGSYGITIPAGFSTNRLSLVDRGFVYAIAHIRGGKDKGDRWYREGKLAKKTNTFSDYIAVARHLIAQGYTDEGRIVGHGGSAGGLLMGVVANWAPSLFSGIIAEVPFVDTLTTILDPSLPLTPPEWSEWGNPIEDEDVYQTMASYSPYDNIEAKPYPHIFALGGLTDPRVTYWEPAKWIAKLRATKTGDHVALLRINMDAGHGGAAGRFHRLEEIALTYAFILKYCG